MKIANHHRRHSKILTSMSVVACLVAVVASGGEYNNNNNYQGKRLLHDNNINNSRITHPSSLTFINKHLKVDREARHHTTHQNRHDASIPVKSVLFNLRCGGGNSETAESDEAQVGDTIKDDVEEEEGVTMNSDDTATSPSLSVDIVSVVDTSTHNDNNSGPLTAEDKLASIAITEEQQHGDDNSSDENKKNNNDYNIDVEETTTSSNDSDDYDDESVVPQDVSIEESTSIQLTSSDATDEDNTSSTILTQQDVNDLISKASNKRLQAKIFHDEGNLNDAAIAFHDAASLLDEIVTTEDNNVVEDVNAIAVERATCKLHEALCLFKNGQPGECIEACSDVLRDGVTVVVVQNDEGTKGGTTADEEAQGDDDDANGEKESPVVSTVTKVISAQTPPSSSSSNNNNNIIPSLIRARAHHRRAKARLALNDFDGALDDARSAAFMGDRNAVQFYGRLMREGSSGSSSSSEASLASPGGLGSMFGSDNGSSLFADNGSSSTNPFLESMLQGMNSGLSGSTNNNNQHPLMPSGAGSSDFQSSLLSSLLNSNNGNGGSGGDPFGLMSSLLSPPSSADDSNNNNKLSKRGRRGKSRKTNGGNNNGGGMDNLAKSVLSSLLKRIEDESTQETICNYLQSTNTQQIMTFASMAGMPLKETNAKRLCSLAHGITKKGIRKSITNIKRSVSIIKTIRKILKVVDKYKVVIVASVALYWIRSAIVKPYPVSAKKVMKELMQKTALSLLIAPSSLSSSCQSGGRLPLGSILCNGVAQTLSKLYLSGNDDMSNGATQTGVEKELERLQNQLSLIEALEERNTAQLDSFIDEQDQWESLEDDERILLSSKDSILERMEVLTEQLVMLFMGHKMRDG